MEDTNTNEKYWEELFTRLATADQNIQEVSKKQELAHQDLAMDKLTETNDILRRTNDSLLLQNRSLTNMVTLLVNRIVDLTDLIYTNEPCADIPNKD